MKNGKEKKLKEKSSLSFEEKQKRLVSLIWLEIDRIIFDLEFREDLLFKLWSKERLREPLCKVLRTKFFDLDFKTLMVLPSDLIENLNNFYKTLEDFIFYVSYTEDMPETMRAKFTAYVKELKKKFKPLDEKLKKIKD
jgi:hypothetical protein